jgi:hypothetical protein
MHHHCGTIIIYQTLSLEEGAVIESTIEANIEHESARHKFIVKATGMTKNQ